MVQQTLTQKTQGNLRGQGNDVTLAYFEDINGGIDVAGILVDSDSFDTGTFLDRDYEVRGFRAISIKIENVGANSLNYSIQEATKDFDNLDADLLDADFEDVPSHTDVTVLTTAKAVTYILLRLSPAVTAVRLRGRTTAAAANTNLRADIKAW